MAVKKEWRIALSVVAGIAATIVAVPLQRMVGLHGIALTLLVGVAAALVTWPLTGR
jgi:hypothetical protein